VRRPELCSPTGRSRSRYLSRLASTVKTRPAPQGRAVVFCPESTRGFSLLELLVVTTILAVLAGLAATQLPALLNRAERAEALGQLRTMGTAVLQYTPDHDGRLPPLFPGQVLEYEEGRGGRIVTECATYLGLEEREGRYLVTSLVPRAYARQKEPDNPAAMRVYVMNTALIGESATIYPFGRVVTGGQPPVGAQPLAALGTPANTWMMSTADQKHPAVASAPWRANAPPEPPLGERRAIFRFDGSAGLVNLDE